MFYKNIRAIFVGAIIGLLGFCVCYIIDSNTIFLKMWQYWAIMIPLILIDTWLSNNNTKKGN